MNLRKLVIIGAGGFGKEVAWLVEDINKKVPTWDLLGFIDDDLSKKGNILNDVEVLGDFNWLDGKLDLYAVCAIGKTDIKQNLVNRGKERGLKFTNLIHPSTRISPYVNLGEGVIICSGVTISTNISIGNHVAINPNSSIAHDCQIGDYVSIFWNVNISGNCKIGCGCEIGTQAILLQGIEVGKWSRIGAGAVVTKTLPEKCKAVGIPAKEK